MPIPGEGVFQRRILRILKEHGFVDRDGRRCMTVAELREWIYGVRRPDWTRNWTLERALRALEARGRIRRDLLASDDLPFYVRPGYIIRYVRN